MIDLPPVILPAQAQAQQAVAARRALGDAVPRQWKRAADRAVRKAFDRWMIEKSRADKRVQRGFQFIPGIWSRTATGYKIERSLRIRGSATGYLARTFASTPTAAGIFTIVFCLKPGILGTADRDIFSATPSDGNYSRIALMSDDKMYFYTGTSIGPNSTRVFRDPTAWCQVCVGVDLTQATASNRVKVEINGVAETLAGTQPAQNSATYFNANGNKHAIGQLANYINQQFDGLIADFYFIDGQQLSATNFGQLDAATNTWNPKAYTGTYGNNGFHLDFSDNSAATATAIGKDSSGNANHWTPTNISVTAGTSNDSLTDVPTRYGTDTGAGGEVRGNYCTWNAVAQPPGGKLTNANLTAGAPDSNYRAYVGTMGLTSGKWYFECTLTTLTNYAMIGVATSAVQFPLANGDTHWNGANGWGYCPNNGNLYNNGGSTAFGAAAATGDVIGIAVDMDNGKLYFSKNGAWLNSGDPVAGTGYAINSLAGNTAFPAITTSNSSIAIDANFGQRPYAYAAPSGFKALCTQNLPDPTIKNAHEHFDINLRTGTGAAFSVTGKSFSPDIIWSKGRSGATSNLVATRSRGAGKYLSTDARTAEVSDAQSVTAFNSDGFSGGTASIFNTSAATYIDWLFRAGGTPVTNTDGSISASVSANTLAGISIITFTGTGAAATVGHGLGIAPKLLIIKQVNNVGDYNWVIYHAAISPSNSLYFTTAAGANNSAAYFNSLAATSSVINIGSDGAVNSSGNPIQIIAFAEIPSFSKVGSYTGNGGADGTYAHCGFRPRFVLIKRTDTTSNWYILDTARDTFNPRTNELLANATNAEANNSRTIDTTAFGFKLRATSAEINASGGTYIYMAIADTSAKYALAA